MTETYILLLRGINVGGHNRLPMADLHGIMEELGARRVRTYIQSGNAAFEYGEELPENFGEQLARRIASSKGFHPKVLALTLDQLEHSVDQNPFPEAEDEPKSLHLYFLASGPPDPDMEAIEDARTGSERYQLDGKVFYLHAPDGIGRSTLATGVERYLGVEATGRNWRSVQKVLEMALG